MARILSYGNDYKSREEMANKPKSNVNSKSGSKPEKKGEGKAEEETGKKEPKAKS